MTHQTPTQQKSLVDQWATPAATVIVAIVGGVFTYFYNDIEDARLRQESNINQENAAYQSRVLEMEVVEKFLPHLLSENPEEQAAAIITIGKLGSPPIATELGKLFDTPGARKGVEFVNTNVAKQTTSPAAVEPVSAPPRWIYLGEYKKKDKEWKTNYLTFSQDALPETLIGKTLPVEEKTGALNVRDRPLGDIVETLQPREKVKIEEIKDYAGLGYIWARVSLQ